MTSAVLLSGGPDSAVLAHDLVHQGHRVVAVHLELGVAESAAALRCAVATAAVLGLELVRLDVDAAGPALGSRDGGVGSARAVHPAFGVALTTAAVTAAGLGADVLACGVHHGESVFRGHQRRGFDALAASVSIAVGRRLVVTTPYLELSKSEVMLRGARLGVDVGGTWSCTQRSDVHCGRCLACGTRRAAVREAGVVDTAAYAAEDLTEVLEVV